ncbi:MAG TPA: histidinol dehydrogenase [Clostridia bacterium]|nr:histidinol dehydrogenase [Clostridia bacterium]
MRVLEGKVAYREVLRLSARDHGSNQYPNMNSELRARVQAIVLDVGSRGEAAVRKYAEEFDGITTDQPLRVPEKDMRAALRAVSPKFIKALKQAAANVKRFAEWQKPKSWMRTILPGVNVGQKVEPISGVGCYVPGGRYPLPSSLLMTVIPAQVAGVKNIAVCSPRPANETLAAGALFGVTQFYRIGGAHAIAAMAFGAAEGLERIVKIVGPGNKYVTMAKQLVSSQCSIDMPAGPTEIVYLAEKGNPAFIASDIVAQAEHDPETLPVFITSSKKLAATVAQAALEMTDANPIARESLTNNGVALVAQNHRQAVDWANAIGAEHITVDAPDVTKITTAGSMFIGPYSPQSLGDYVSGPNHVLPTGNVARYRGGLSVFDFLKIITVQEVTKAGLRRIGPTAITLAEAEGLKAHAESVRARLR